jgi:ATP-dependent DNA ligase
MRRSVPSPLDFIKPEIRSLVPEPPSGGDGFTNQHDGYRTLINIDQGKVRAISRRGRHWTGPYKRVVEGAAQVCHPDSSGHPTIHYHRP